MAFHGYFPAVKPASAPVGLLNSDGVAVVNHGSSDEAWMHGPQTVESLAAAFFVMVSDYCSNAADSVIHDARGECTVPVYPFGIVTYYETSGIGLTLEERKSRVLAMAEVSTQKSVETELSSGVSALAGGHVDARYLQMVGAYDVTGAAVSAQRALGALERALGEMGQGDGIIHITRDVATLLAQDLRNVDNKIYTVLGTPVVVGSGYDGAEYADAGPVGPVAAPAVTNFEPAPTTQWIYATGPVTVHLGDVSYIGERINTEENVITVMAAQPAAVYWDSPSHFAAEVNLAA